jgi:hypothetical protein
MQVKITNIVPNLDLEQLTVFYQFSNGAVHSERVPITTTMQELVALGNSKRDTLVQMEAHTKQLREEYYTSLELTEENE